MRRDPCAARGRAPRRALTLAELLVALGAVGLLIGLLVPVLAHGKAAGRTAQCASNLRQMAVAAQGYAMLHSVYPAAIRYAVREDALHAVAWDWETTVGAAAQLVGPGPLWSFSGDPGRVQQCPEYPGSTNFADPYTGYNYNPTYVGAESPFPYRAGWGEGWDHLRPGVRAHACRRSSQCALFGDGGMAAGVANKFMRAPTATVEGDLGLVYAGAQAFRHAGATSVAWLDGHVSSTARVRPGRFADEALLRDMVYPRNGFLSDGDEAYDPR